MIHWIACLWFLVTNQMKSWNPPKDVDWNRTEVYTGITFDKYIIFFYYSVLTIVANELMPTTMMEITLSIGILMTGSLTIGVLIGEFSSILNDMNERA